MTLARGHHSSLGPLPDFLARATPRHAEAFSQFCAQGLPDRTLESYKYSSIASAVRGLDLVPCASRVHYEGVRPELLQPHQAATPHASSVPQGALVLLNQALNDTEIVLGVPDGLHLVDPIRFDWTTAHGEFSNPRLRLVLGRGARVTLIEQVGAAASSWINGACRIDLGAGAQLSHVRIQNVAGVLTQDLHVQGSDDATYRLDLLHSGPGFARFDAQLDLQGTGARMDVRAAHVLQGKAHADLTMTARHLAPQTHSNQNVRSLIDGAARGVYQGKIFVDRAALDTDGYQLSKAMLLSPLAEMDTKPELEIYADRVKCSHGATTGALDDDQLFYLCARGVPQSVARAMLMRAFISGLFDGDRGEMISELDRLFKTEGEF